MRIGNHGTSKIMGIDDIHDVSNIRCRLVLKNVRHILDLRLNLKIPGNHDEDGFNNHFGTVLHYKKTCILLWLISHFAVI